MRYALVVLRIALAFALLYAAISSLIAPDNWVGWFPQFIFEIVPEHIALPIHSIAEIILALWLLSGWKTWIAASISALALITIVVFNIPQMDIVFRDIALAIAAIALTIGSHPKQRSP